MPSERERVSATAATASSSNRINLATALSFQQMAIPLLAHPPRAREVGLPTAPGSIWLACGIALQHVSRNFVPLNILRCCVEEAQVGNQVTLIVTRKLRRRRGFVIDVGAGLMPPSHITLPGKRRAGQKSSQLPSDSGSPWCGDLACDPQVRALHLSD